VAICCACRKLRLQAQELNIPLRLVYHALVNYLKCIYAIVVILLIVHIFLSSGIYTRYKPFLQKDKPFIKTIKKVSVYLAGYMQTRFYTSVQRSFDKYTCLKAGIHLLLYVNQQRNVLSKNHDQKSRT
jgi:hypothetical protein